MDEHEGRQQLTDVTRGSTKPDLEVTAEISGIKERFPAVIVWFDRYIFAGHEGKKFELKNIPDDVLDILIRLAELRSSIIDMRQKCIMDKTVTSRSPHLGRILEEAIGIEFELLGKISVLKLERQRRREGRNELLNEKQSQALIDTVADLKGSPFDPELQTLSEEEEEDEPVKLPEHWPEAWDSDVAIGVDTDVVDV